MAAANNSSNDRANNEVDMESSFGFTTIQPEEKQAKVNEVFHSVANKYDLMNDIMSFGLHRAWKSSFITKLNPAKYTPWRLLDVAGGTGDIAFKALRSVPNNKEASVTLLDINSSMLEVGKNRAIKNQLDKQVTFVEGDAQELPFEDNSFDAYTISFGIRNVPHIDKALKEACRVLKPGGHFLCMEFSQVQIPLIEKLYDVWSFNFIPKIGELIAGDKDSYQYLVESIRKFPNQENFKIMIEKSGFKRCNYHNLSGGIATIHEAWKI